MKMVAVRVQRKKFFRWRFVRYLLNNREGENCNTALRHKVLLTNESLSTVFSPPSSLQRAISCLPPSSDCSHTAGSWLFIHKLSHGLETLLLFGHTLTPRFTKTKKTGPPPRSLIAYSFISLHARARSRTIVKV